QPVSQHGRLSSGCCYWPMMRAAYADRHSKAKMIAKKGEGDRGDQRGDDTKRTYRSALTHVRFGRRSGRDVIGCGAKTATLTHFAYRIDMWDANSENIFEHLG